MSGGGIVEIACDESGSEGDKLIGGTTDVFAHASIDVPVDLAASWLDEVRRRCRSPADEIKASVVLREQNRAVLRDLIGPAGPYAPGQGAALVQLVDKRQHLAGRLLALLGDGEDAHPLEPAGLPDVADPLLIAFNALMRARSLEEAQGHATSVRREAEVLSGQVRAATPAALVARAGAAVPTSEAALLHLLDRGRPEAVLDPLVPVVAAAVGHWASGGSRVRVVHDEQRTLRGSGLVQLHQLCAETAFDGVRFVDSRDDPRVQLADFLAGAARRVASEALAGRRDVELWDLLEVHMSGPVSGWADTPRGVVLP